MGSVLRSGYGSGWSAYWSHEGGRSREPSTTDIGGDVDRILIRQRRLSQRTRGVHSAHSGHCRDVGPSPHEAPDSNVDCSNDAFVDRPDGVDADKRVGTLAVGRGWGGTHWVDRTVWDCLGTPARCCTGNESSASQTIPAITTGRLAAEESRPFGFLSEGQAEQAKRRLLDS